MGDRVSIQFKKDGRKSVALFCHWGGMAFVEKAKQYAVDLINECNNETYPLYRLEPETVMVDFIKTILGQQPGRIESNFYLGADETNGDNSDNGNYIIDLDILCKKNKMKPREEIGQIKVLQKNICASVDCDCGWNITLGGTSKDDLELILDTIKKHNLVWVETLTEGDGEFD